MCVRLSFSCKEEPAAFPTDCGYAFITKPALWFHLCVCMSDWLILSLPPSSLLPCSTKATHIILGFSIYTCPNYLLMCKVGFTVWHRLVMYPFIWLCCGLSPIRLYSGMTSDGLHTGRPAGCYFPFPTLSNMWKWNCSFIPHRNDSVTYGCL